MEVTPPLTTINTVINFVMLHIYIFQLYLLEIAFNDDDGDHDTPVRPLE